MGRRFFPLFSSGDRDEGGGGGGGCGGITSTISTAGATRALRRTERVTAGAAGARYVCHIRSAGCGGCGGGGVVLVVLAEGIHAAHRAAAAALTAGVRDDDVLRGRAGELRGVEVGVSAQFVGAEVRELGEVEVDGFVAEGQERFEARGRRRVELDGVGEGRDVIRCCGGRAKVGEDVVIPGSYVKSEVFVTDDIQWDDSRGASPVEENVDVERGG